jgi:hypothetical protein
MYREIKPEKIRQLRGERSRAAVIKAANNALTEQDLWGYETGAWKPSKKKLPHLLAALNTTYDKISEPVELQAA